MFGIPTPTHDDYQHIVQLIRRVAGIDLGGGKKDLVKARLAKRIRHHNLSTFKEYISLLQSISQHREQQEFIDLLTTNETSFFRESAHFEFLTESVLPHWRKRCLPFRVWSAAASSGEEAYSVAMVLDDHLGTSAWAVVGTDISKTVLEIAKAGCYSLSRCQTIPNSYRQRYCCAEQRGNDGILQIEDNLKRSVEFHPVNLVEPCHRFGQFNAIFLRNVLIYFDRDTRVRVVGNILKSLLPGGYLIVGHSEKLNDSSDELTSVTPTIYRKSG